MAFGFVKYPFMANANKKIKADQDRWENSYPVWVPCCVMIPFGWLFRGRKFPSCKKNSLRRRWEEEQKKGPPPREQTKYPETSISPCSLRPRKADDNISNFELDRSRGLDASILKRLPLEIRQEIYGYVLGRQENCLVMLPFKIRATTGKNMHPGKNVSKAHTNQYIFLEEENRFWPHRPALLRTCRQIYVEAVSLLYTGNTFVFRHPEVLRRFKRSIAPQRWHCIRSLRFCLLYSGSKAAYLFSPAREEDWRQLWFTIASMKNLINLDVELIDKVDVEVGPWEFIDKLCQSLLTPLLQLRGLHHFQLTLFPDHGEKCSPDLGPVPLAPETRALIRLIEDTVKLPREACLCWSDDDNSDGDDFDRRRRWIATEHEYVSQGQLSHY